ncbi:MAG: hypothetical protein U0996_05640 [Planctomycetaceae bacterium]
MCETTRSFERQKCGTIRQWEQDGRGRPSYGYLCSEHDSNVTCSWGKFRTKPRHLCRAIALFAGYDATCELDVLKRLLWRNAVPIEEQADGSGYWLTLFLSGIVAFSSAAITEGGDEHSGTTLQQDPVATNLVSGWLAEQEKIVHAHYVVEGGFEKNANDPTVRDNFRIEGWISPEAERYESEWDKANGFASAWILRNDQIISWPYGGGKAVCIGVHKPSKRDWKSCARIDPRCDSLLGVMAFPDRFTSFRELRDTLTHGYNYLDTKEIEPGVYEFILQDRRVVTQSPAKYLTKIRINERKGFSIERMEQYELLPGKNLPGDLVCWTDTEWKEISKVWVPIKLSGECYDNGNMTKKAKAEYRWISINDPIPDERFDPSDFDVSDGKLIVDYRTSPDNGVLIGRIVRPRLEFKD